MVDSGIQAKCPTCGAQSLSLTSTTHEIPYFGEVLTTVLQCTSCGFRHTDFLPLSQRDPARYTLEIASPEDLRSRVVRSNSGTYRIPEVGFTASPTPQSESFVTSVEGLIERVRDIFLRTRILTDLPEQKRLLDERIAYLAEVLEGRKPATLIVEDPLGHSAIVSDRARVAALTPAEAKELSLGAFVLDRDDVGT